MVQSCYHFISNLFVPLLEHVWQVSQKHCFSSPEHHHLSYRDNPRWHYRWHLPRLINEAGGWEWKHVGMATAGLAAARAILRACYILLHNEIIGKFR